MEVKLTHNLDILIGKINTFGGGAKDKLADVLLDCMQIDVLPKWYAHVTLPELTEAERRALDWPYSTRHPQDSGPSPDYDVHEVSTDLIDSTRIESSTTGGGDAIVRLVNSSEHYEFIRYGTSKMRMRDPGGEALGEAIPDVQQRVEEETNAMVVEVFGT